MPTTDPALDSERTERDPGDQPSRIPIVPPPAQVLNIDAIRAREQAATKGPWWSDEDGDMWRLHGIHAGPLNQQILKAPKRGTPYAEYWPDQADAEFITHSRE